jgi:hypothetical protein
MLCNLNLFLLRRIFAAVVGSLLCLPCNLSRADFPNPHAADLPPWTLIGTPARRDVPTWLQTNLRIGHLQG